MSFPRYPKYTDSGVKWLGEVPDHWNAVRLKTLLAEVDERAEDQHLELLGLSKAVGVVRRSELEQNASESDDHAKYKVADAGHLVMNKMQAWNGVFGLSPMRGMVSPDYAVFRFLQHGFDEFLCSLFRTEMMAGVFFMRCRGMGTAFLRLNSPDLLDIKVPLPTAEDAKRISAFLYQETAKIDALVVDQHRLIELLKEKRQAVISSAVSKGLNPDAPVKPSGIEWLGEVPMTWTVTKLGRVAFMQEGPGLRNWQFTADGTRVICVTNITEHGIDFRRLEKFISIDEYNSSYRHFTVTTGDVLLSSSGNSWGKVAIYEGEEEVILNTSTIRLNELERRPLIRDFLAILLQSDTAREQLGLAMTGSCQPNFGPTHLSGIIVAVPSVQEQSDIVAFVARGTATLDALTAEAERAIALLQERRAALISAAVTGKIDVRGLVNTEAA